MADIQDLLSRLKSPEAQSGTAAPSANPLSHLFATPDSSSKPAASVEQLPSTAQEASNANRTANLLNLLKFNGANSPALSTATSTTPAGHRSSSAAGPIPSGSMSDDSRLKNASLHLPNSGQGDSSQRSQDILLNLLNRSQQSTPSAANPLLGAREGQASSQNANSSPRIFGNPALPSQDAGFTSPSVKGPPFSHINPFEQLASSRDASPGPMTSHGTKAKKDLSSKSPMPSPLPDGRTQLDALLGIGSSQANESVSQALEAISGQVDKDSNRALARAETDASPDDAKQAVQAIKAAEKVARKSSKNSTANVSTSQANSKSFSRTVEQNNDAAADSWESADADEASRDTTAVKVYNFPMRPFVSITVKNSSPSIPRDDIIMKIASLKKEFDQVDRALATASANFIVYALAKGGGARAIRQDIGENKLAFRGNGNTMFNVAISAPRSSPMSKESESILMTGTNGSVYWTSLPTAVEEFESANLDQRGFILPPAPSAEEPTSTAQLKTRAKKSSRHPEFFGVGRGKSIYIVHPNVVSAPEYLDAHTRMVDSAKFFSERTLKVSTGKAGKDFAFSEDDSVLASLDKSGKLKFWNILSLTGTEHGMRTGKRPPQEVNTPLLTLMVDVSADKSSPTSVQFVDKERPTLKGSALRYMLVGLRQNHTLQLWDLGLGKAVQELNLPHDDDTDPICSISYHAKSGIVAMGHPKRNSIFLVHLSAPRYNLDMMSQANYIQRLALKDQTLPKPESTAILSGLREISLAPIGDLRSLEVVTPSTFTVEKVEPEDETMFEIYAMHSRGVTCLSMKRMDLGWTADGKVPDALDAEAEGVITVRELQVAPAAESPVADEAQVKAIAKTTKPKAEPAKSESPSKLPAANGDSKADKKKAKKRAEEVLDLSAVPPPTSTLEGTAEATKAQPKLLEKLSATLPIQPADTPVSDPAPSALAAQQSSTNQRVASTEDVSSADGKGSSANIQMSTETIAPLFDKLYKRIDDERRIQEAAANSKQDAILRLVSSTLTDNVEKSLNRIIALNVQQSVAPAASNAATASVDRNLAELLPQHLGSLLPREVKTSVQAGLVSALQHKDVLKEIANKVSSQVTGQVEAELRSALQKTLVPAMKNVAIESAQKAGSEVENRLGEQLRQSELQRRADADKIDHLTKTSQDIMQAMQSLQQSLVTMQQEMSQLRVQLAEQQSAQQQASGSAPATQPQQAEPETDHEVAAIRDSMAAGKAEEATIRWLQSSRQTELFDSFFVQCDPAYLQNLNPLVSLSVSMAVTSSLDSHVQQRLAWLEIVLNNFDTESSDISEYAPRLLEVLSGRMQDAYMEIADKRQGDPALPKISSIVRRIRDLRTHLSTH